MWRMKVRHVMVNSFLVLADCNPLVGLGGRLGLTELLRGRSLVRTAPYSYFADHPISLS